MVAQGNVLTQFQLFSEGFADVEVDRHGPEAAIRQPHVLDHAVIVFLGQETFERVETAVHQKLQIADLTRSEIKAHQIAGFDFQFLRRLV